jgi:predicted nucleotidyltransferase
MLLNSNNKQMILEILKQQMKTDVELWAFGSRVNNKAHSGSDLDLVIKSKNNKILDIVELGNFKEALTESNIPFLVDVLDWGKIPNSFKENINKKHEVLKL